MDINVTDVSGTELYHRYPGQSSPQGCYVELDPGTGELSASYSADTGNAVPFAVYHGRVLRWPIPALQEGPANALLEAIVPLAEVISAGYSEGWDGHNTVGVLSEEAKEAEDEIQNLCERAGEREDDLVQAWDAADWLSGIGTLRAQAADMGITAETTDEDLEEIADKQEYYAVRDGVDILEGLLVHLEAIREHMRDLAAKAEADEC